MFNWFKKKSPPQLSFAAEELIRNIAQFPDEWEESSLNSSEFLYNGKRNLQLHLYTCYGGLASDEKWIVSIINPQGPFKFNEEDSQAIHDEFTRHAALKRQKSIQRQKEEFLKRLHYV